ncbi:GNAT family N-acetyltransferase [Adlercreutzia murintestinalis]|jgi:Acetyltransferases, including N-acetylases of ribosomal proteins|uniref:GNAT family N-acetyltransferase n=1 Tax=Adlercreutzia murintestinalis TaxID=2941325 RepID=UPI00203D7BB3|nr:GNAT family protein [Adlercreutzia murintestinalis]
MSKISALQYSDGYKALRPLDPKDAPGMLEWMHDPAIAGLFQTDFGSMGTNEVLAFIDGSQGVEDALHLAIIDDNDKYMGTISLKNIDMTNRCAEYAISTRSIAHGTGLAYQATLDILDVAFKKLELNRVYLNVLDLNGRARGFYEKVGFSYEGRSRQALRIDSAFHDLLWFSVLQDEFEQLTD